ncbi:MAG: bifunctional enoyl-CoA hydratase/phosphate acetyltransferase [Candidatus Cloacimonetes bacterium]|nr:bifunctional enoyl-CoA hydratase/phosphate acetyltransferase [Candidatus Cloacimonadota bacterium]
MLKNFDELLNILKNKENKTVIIAAAHTPSALEAAILSKKENIAESLLIGDKKYIIQFFKDNFPDYIDSFEIIDTKEDLVLSARLAIQAAKDGKGDLILKGKCHTAILLRAALDKEKGLRTGNSISDVMAYEHPERIVLLSDGGINLYPTLKEKISIIKNSVKVAHKLHNDNPKVALLAAMELVNPKMPNTLDDAIICKMNQRGQIKGCIIDGPLAFDNAVSKEAADSKGIVSEVAGDADILIVPSIESANIFGKSLTYYCNFRVAHVVMGAKVPILIASRADTAETKMLSIALSIMCA